MRTNGRRKNWPCFARRLATDPKSSMRGRVAVAPKNDFSSAKMISKYEMKISFATVVSGIVRLISSNPKSDNATLRQSRFSKRSSLSEGRPNGPPFRKLYLEEDDALIYAATRNFVNVADELFWRDAPPNSFIRKTVGVQALFDVYRELAGPMLGASEAALTAGTTSATRPTYRSIRVRAPDLRGGSSTRRP
jgi:hypothetical protein